MQPALEGGLARSTAGLTAAVIANTAVAAELGHLGEWLDVHDIQITRLVRDDVLAINAADDADILIVLGSEWTLATPMTGTAGDAIAAEVALVRQWLRTDRPFLGICFGGQLLSHALGGVVSILNPHRTAYVGWTTPASPLPVMRKPWMLWHQDWFTVPPGGELLASASHAPLAFRHGRAWGMQWHPEVDADILQQIAIDLHASQQRYGPMVAVARERAEEQRAESLALFDAWWADVS